MTEDEESKRRSEEFNSLTTLFMQALDVEEVLAQLLAVEGFTSVEEVAFIDSEELASIEGFNADLAQALKDRANKYIEKNKKAFDKKAKELGIDQDLINLLDLSQEKIIKLAEVGIKTIEDLAELRIKEFNEILPDSGLANDQIRDLINLAKKQSSEQS
jgi:N utilization substance protein A